MAFMKKISFWRGSSKGCVIEPFEAQEQEAKATNEGPLMQASISPKAVSKVTPQSACDTDLATIEQVAPIKEAPSKAPKQRVSFAETTMSDATTRTPSPADEASKEGEECINFDSRLEITSAAIGQAFGQNVATSLRSAKWDKRAQALKSMGTVLKGLDLQGMSAPGHTGVLGRGLRLRDRSRCWRLSCQLLHHVLNDKVMPVKLAALELFTETFTNASAHVEQVEARYAAGVLLEHIIEKLGDSNLRLHESARKCVFFAAERPGMLGLGVVLRSLRERLDTAGHRAAERTKVNFGVLDTVNVLLEHFPPRRERARPTENEDEELEEVEVHKTSTDSWVAEDVIPFIISGMDDSLVPRVRNTATSLAVTVYKALGSEAMEPLQSLRPAKQALLKQKFQDIARNLPQDIPEDDDDDDGEERPDLDGLGLMICGSAMQAPSTKSAQRVNLPNEVDEDAFMDDILEETGMVFNGAGIVHEEHLDEDFLLQEELAELGLDLDFEELEEQQALLDSLCECEGLSLEHPGDRRFLDDLSLEAF